MPSNYTQLFIHLVWATWDRLPLIRREDEQGIKGSTSYLMNHAIAPEREFKWQGSYGAFTVSKSLLDNVANYVRNQKQHHANRLLDDEWERCDADADQPTPTN